MVTTMNKTFRIALVVASLLPLRAFALHRQTPPMQMLSSKNTGNIPSIPGLGVSSTPSAQGGVAGWIAFQSTADLKSLGGTFAGGQQVFLFDNNPDDGGRTLLQVTNKLGISENPSTTVSGTIVAFDSDARLLNVGPVGPKQIYTWNRKSGQFSQWTFGNQDSTHPVLNQKGTQMIFLSQADLLGNGSSGQHVFMWRPSTGCVPGLGCGQILQLTPVGNSLNANAIYSPEGASSYVLFNSNGPIDGPSNGHQQIVLFDKTFNSLKRLTNFAGGDSIKPNIDVTRRYVSFQSNADPLGNGSTGWQVFVLDLETKELKQITNAPSGESTEPSLGFNADYLAFVSTSDLLENGSHQRNLFLYDLRTKTTYQFTKDSADLGNPTDTHHPLATGGTIFFFDTAADLLHVGNGYRQVYSLNVFNWLPGANLGFHDFKIKAGTADGGSKARISTSSAETVFDLDAGELAIAFGARSVESEAALEVAQDDISLPPIPMPHFGALCIEATGDGTGMIDCDGGHEDVNVSSIQDHATDDEDQFCTLGCREGETCQGPLPGPNFRACDYCVKTCKNGPNGGLVCQNDAECGGGICSGECSVDSLQVGDSCTANPSICNPVEACQDGLRGICRGPEVTSLHDPFGAGAARLTIPVAGKLSNSAGVDGLYCTDDDTYPVQGLSAVLRLTTSASEKQIKDPDAVLGADLTKTEYGLPFDCSELVKGNLNGATFVGSLHFLNVPDAPGFHDMIVGLSFSSGECTTNCPQPCTVDADCDDGSLCSGTETCGLDGYCKAGTPVVCSDNNACNGLETCNPTDGTCLAGTAPNCDDSNACTTDSCVAATGCVNQEKNCQNGDLCDGTETCNPADGTCLPGVPPICDDGNPCTGVETCSPQYGCLAGAPIVCSDGNACNGQETCDPGTGSCLPGVSLSCDDGNPCTGVEVCDSLTGCLPGVPIDCQDGDQCDGTETCDSGTGSCISGTALVCDDGSACTVDSCDAILGCVHDVLGGFSGVHCVLSILQSELAMTPSSGSIAPKLQAKLRKTVDRVIARIDSAERAQPKYRVRHARHSAKMMKAFVRSLQIAETVGKCSGPVCGDLEAMGNQAMQAIAPLAVKP